MKLAFVAANRQQMPDPVIPLGLLCVMGAVPEHHTKVLWDLCFEADPVEALRSHLMREQPELVAFGLRNIQNNDYSGIHENVAYYASLVAAVREVSDAKILLGGGGFSVMPAELMERLRPDFGVWGEGELPLPRLLEALERGGSNEALAEVPNLLWFEDGALAQRERVKAYVDMDLAPIADRRAVDPRYYEVAAIESIQTKRGCNLRCDYCTYPLIEGRVTRRRSPERVADEFASVLEQHPNTRHAFIVDSVFNLPPNHAKAVCRALIERGNTLPWTCYANPLRFDYELAELMVEAGCTGVEVGTDSGVDEVLDRLRKGFSTDQVMHLRECARGAGLKDCHSFILGTPGETLAEVERTLAFIDDLDPFAAILGVWVDDLEALDPELRAGREELRGAIHERLREICAVRPRWIVPPMGINFEPRVFSALRRGGLSGPLWQYLDRKPNVGERRPPSFRRTSARLPVLGG